MLTLPFLIHKTHAIIATFLYIILCIIYLYCLNIIIAFLHFVVDFFNILSKILSRIPEKNKADRSGLSSENVMQKRKRIIHIF